MTGEKTMNAKIIAVHGFILNNFFYKFKTHNFNSPLIKMIYLIYILLIIYDEIKQTQRSLFRFLPLYNEIINHKIYKKHR